MMQITSLLSKYPKWLSSLVDIVCISHFSIEMKNCFNPVELLVKIYW